MNNKILPSFVLLLFSGLSFAETAPALESNGQQLSPLTNVRVSMQRMLRSSEERYFLDLYAGVWNPKATLYDELNQTEMDFKGAQKGDVLELKSVNMPEGKQSELKGYLNANSGVFDAVLVNADGAKNVRFEPAFKAVDKPVFVFKFYGVEEAAQPYGKVLKRVDVVDKNTGKIKQSLTGFNAFANSVGYMDVNFDGYYDLVLSDISDAKKVEDKRFVYWMFNPKTMQFQRSAQLDALVGFPRLHGNKQQIDFGNNRLYRVRDGLMYLEP
ncbi:XAC2610-related protein [Acinetobacter tianfuensis]|uniref:VCBS repeat-containing protein n=1 Tax=Acinetobacter tianfuensis TaxID=2419603 RepID=A0A3A8ETA3_9GAMM|nr:hypothetical protein [Acinetobacter tianfuensis]RKG33244.1 hypothetical protein D7V32_03730 [Acinetobacter tianfuensis]